MNRSSKPTATGVIYLIQKILIRLDVGSRICPVTSVLDSSLTHHPTLVNHPLRIREANSRPLLLTGAQCISSTAFLPAISSSLRVSRLVHRNAFPRTLDSHYGAILTNAYVKSRRNEQTHQESGKACGRRGCSRATCQEEATGWCSKSYA